MVRPVNPPQQDLGPLELDAGSHGIRASHGLDIDDKLEAMVDPDTTKLGAMHPAAIEAHPALLWASTGTDPLAAAVLGVPTGPSEVLAATKGILARIDSSAGAVLGDRAHQQHERRVGVHLEEWAHPSGEDLRGEVRRFCIVTV